MTPALQARIEALRAVCVAATQGEWFRDGANVNHVSGAAITTTWTDPRDASFIATFNPETQRALLTALSTALEALQNIGSDARKPCSHCDHGYGEDPCTCMDTPPFWVVAQEAIESVSALLADGGNGE